MSACAKKIVKKAAERIGDLPPDWEELKLKDSVPKKTDWGNLNSAICREFSRAGCDILESELDDFWSENKKFKDVFDYVDEECPDLTCEDQQAKGEE